MAEEASKCQKGIKDILTGLIGIANIFANSKVEEAKKEAESA